MPTPHPARPAVTVEADLGDHDELLVILHVDRDALTVDALGDGTVTLPGEVAEELGEQIIVVARTLPVFPAHEGMEP